MRVTHKCNDCGHYSEEVRCPECGSMNTGNWRCDECGWAFNPDCNYDCPNCGSDDTVDIGEDWDNRHDSDWMYPNGYYEG